MKVVEGAKVYQCDHCGKKSHHGSSLKRHERFCPKKPENQHQCFKWCKHLEKHKQGLTTVFSCPKVDRLLYSFKAEKAGLFVHGEDADYMRMPLQCPQYEDKDPAWWMRDEQPDPF